MSNTPHTLGEEFPGQLDAIHALKAADPRFAKILEDYDDVNDQIHRAETKIEPTSQDNETELRKRRLALKDEIAKALEGKA
ncbi:YdcH family protein [Pseudochrobactrum sp. HB0163]|uniref:YdcH family protein n=1 Tax=Pseudochrobactrum sp. HB0163 TaxID=3450708 RepID=UPI003F6DFBDB